MAKGVQLVPDAARCAKAQKHPGDPEIVNEGGVREQRVCKGDCDDNTMGYSGDLQ